MNEVTLRPAYHAAPQDYWRGPRYEINMTFASLRDDEWQRVLHAVWGASALSGPLNARYLPNVELAMTAIMVPPPTTALTQHGLIWLQQGIGAGCSVLVTRSLFECISVQIPAGMFEELDVTPGLRLPALEAVLHELALTIFRQVPFRLATTGWDRGCALETELQDPTYAAALAAQGGCFVAEELLTLLPVSEIAWQQAIPGLCWLPFNA